MKKILILLLLAAPALYAQKLDAWLTREAEEDPQAYLIKAATRVPATSSEAAGNFFVLGRCYHYLNREDLALKYYVLSKKEFEKLKLDEPAKDLALEIHRLISSQENYDSYGDAFLKEYFEYAQKTGSKEKLALSYNEFAKNAYSLYDPHEEPKRSVLDSANNIYLKSLYYANQTDDSDVKVRVYTNLGALETTRKNFSASRSYLDQARDYVFESEDKFALFANYFNYGNNYFLEKKYADAITWFQKAETIQVPKFREKSKRLLYKKLMESFDYVNDQANRRKYQDMYLDLDQHIKDEEQNIAIHDINVKYQVDEKDRHITALEKFKDKFYKNRLIFGILLFLVFLMALYSFVRWKKIDYSRKKLEFEKLEIQAEKEVIEEIHSKTVEELEKVRNIVTEGFILLKDKTKLYLNDLMYVKAEDHYLHAFSNDGTSHFVRGKLSQILSELPPNFVKCHRSYIVNSNYIQSVQQGSLTLKNKTEIPVSRGFKLS